MVDLWEFKEMDGQTSSLYISYGEKKISTNKHEAFTYHRVALCNSSRLQAHLGQAFGQLHAVHPTAGRDVSFAAYVDVHFAYWRGSEKRRRTDGVSATKIHKVVTWSGTYFYTAAPA